MTRSFKRSKLRIPLRERVRRAGRLVFLLIILTLIPVLLLFQLQPVSSQRFTGVVEGESETVGAIGPARILSVEVRPGQRVKPGDVLVRLDMADRSLDLAMHEARLLDYEQGLRRYEQELLQHIRTLQESERRSSQMVQEAQVAMEEQRMNRARDEAELIGIRAEIQRLTPLIEKRLVSEIELSDLRPRADALEQAVAFYEPLIAALQSRHDLAVRDLENVRALLKQAHIAQDTTQARESLRQVTHLYREATTQEPSVLRASRAGVVSRVQYQSGDVVVAGVPIVRVTSESSIYITGMLTQRQLAGLSVGDRVRVQRLSGERLPNLLAEVELIEPEVMDLIDPFNPAPRFPVRGRRVRMRILNENGGLVPGETVALQPLRQASWIDAVRRASFFSESRLPVL